MTQPSVTLNELDGALGVLPPSAGALFAVLGVSSDGPFDTPAAYASVPSLRADFGDGPMVEAAAHFITQYGGQVVVVRTEASTEGSYVDEVDPEDGTISAITKTGAGTATFTDNSSDPLVAGSWKVVFIVGGTQGTGGIVYQVFKDNVSQLVAGLGTAANFTIPGTQISIAVSALGTIVAGDFITFTTTAPIPASAGEVVYEGLQNAPSLDGTTHPQDDYEVKILFINGGTRGIAGITYKWSLDGGRTYSKTTALGTATSIIVPDSGGVKIDLGSGTIDDDAFIEFPTVAPHWSTSEIGTALDALSDSVITWRDAFITGAIAPGDFDAIEAKFVAMHAAGKYHDWLGGVRNPVGEETEADYRSSLEAAFSDRTTVLGELCAGAQEMVSSVSGRRYKRSSAFVVAAREGSVAEQINIAAIRRGQGGGPLPCSIRDDAGNPKHHDESVNPGLDDLRFTVLRTWSGRPGVFVNRPRIFSSETSDFQLMAHRRVMNLAKRVVRAELEEILNSPLRVDRDTGRILEVEAQAIEAVVRAKLDAALVPGPKASGSSFVLSRTDNILSTKTLNYQVRVIPLGYAEFITGDIAFENPALQVQAVA